MKGRGGGQPGRRRRRRRRPRYQRETTTDKMGKGIALQPGHMRTGMYTHTHTYTWNTMVTYFKMFSNAI